MFECIKNIYLKVSRKIYRLFLNFPVVIGAAAKNVTCRPLAVVHLEYIPRMPGSKALCVSKLPLRNFACAFLPVP